jgi:hypothetical protein
VKLAFIPEQKQKKALHLNELDVRNSLVVSTFITKNGRVETLQPELEFVNFKALLKSGIFKCICWLNGSFLRVMIGDFLKEEVETI